MLLHMYNLSMESMVCFEVLVTFFFSFIFKKYMDIFVGY